MSQEIYSQIVELKNETDDIKRGRDFEALIREIMPWDQRPPIVSSQDSEQLDGVFIYKGLTYIIESKAVKKTITAGMHEWEDFALKINDRRDKRVIGLFCCLFDISDPVLSKARDLNMKGMQTIIISGKTWNELNTSGIYFPSFLDYMMLLSNVKNKSSVDSIKSAQTWIYDGKTINQHFTNNVKKISGSFLRRFKHKYHEQIFVERKIDGQIKLLMKGVAPQFLKTKKTNEINKQIIIIRDFSGSGKTTLSINLAAANESSYCLATTANLTIIDEIIDHLLDLNKYPNFGLNELLAVNKPFLFIVDSLDETPIGQHVHKRKEIKSLLKRVEELNAEALKRKFSSYPIMLMFTIREEYWRNWEGAFEGRQDVVHLKKVLANFNSPEFQDALLKYSQAYNYSIVNHINKQAEDILSIPINLEIFSEANHYEGDITVDDIWEGKILSNYFSKKEEALLSKHHIVNFDTDIFYGLLCSLSYKLLTDKNILFSKAQFKKLVSELYGDRIFNSDQILLNLISEQIIISDSDNVKSYRFKYIRFIEYLIALHIIKEVERIDDFKFIDRSIQVIYDSNFMSIYSVLNNIKHICRTQFTELERDIIDYYSHSDTFLKKYLPELRGKIARGEHIPEDAIKSIITNNFIQSPQTSWNTFFIVAAKNSHRKKETILAAFILAWETNKFESSRWKLINKLADRSFLVEERVIYVLFKDSTSREWEEYLGKILSNKLNIPFINLWHQIEGDAVLNSLVEKSPQEWNYANRLLSLIYRNEGYMLGDIFSDEPQKEYITFDLSISQKLPYLTIDEKKFCDTYIEEFNFIFNGNSPKSFFLAYRLKDLNKDTQKYINIILEPLLKGNHSINELPFLNYIIRNAPETNAIIRTTIDTPFLDLLFNDSSQDERSLFQEVILSEYPSKTELLQFIFNRGYKKAQSDEEFIHKSIKNNNEFSTEEFESILLGYCFLKIKNKEDYSKLKTIYREICVLLISKFNRIVLFKFPNFLQVANNALEHYKQFGKLFLLAFNIYERYPELENKPSFQKKAQAFDNEKIIVPQEYFSLLSSIFPELF